MPVIISLLLYLMMHTCDVIGNGCQGDRNKDHRLRVSCVNQGLSALPGGIDPLAQVLVLTENRFSSFSWSDYSAFTHLHELDLSYNEITELEPPGPVLENLSVLRLSGNRLTGLGGGVFRCAPSLMEIYLDGNLIRSLHDGAFSDLQRLEVIDLSGNKLPALPPRLLERISSSGLKTFDLENNSISLMPSGFFSSKPELPYVYLSHNPWLCSCSVDYLHSYLNDQDHNVYIHDGPDDIVPGAETVLCTGPAHLTGRPVLDLKEDEFCPPEPTFPPLLYPSGDQDFRAHDVIITTAEEETTPPPHLSTSLVWSEFWTNRLTESEHLLRSTMTPLNSHPEPFINDTDDTINQSSISSTQARPQTTVSLITARPEPASTAELMTAQRQLQTSTGSKVQATSMGPQWAEGGRATDGRLLPWCWWLFAGYVLLCVLSALTSCFLFLWLLKNYLTLYGRLQRYAASCSDSDGVTLCAYRRTENTEPRGEENEETVRFLKLEQIKDVQAVFRSVLYVSKEDDERLRDRDASTTVELVSVSESERAEGRENVTFRKTMYRLITDKQQHNRWTEEDQHCCSNTERPTTRYSLILRETTGNMEWVMGEWEMEGSPAL